MEEGGSRRGHVPVLVGEREEDMEKIWVTIKAIQHLTIVELLDQSLKEYGHQKGLLKIKYDVNKFKAILHNVSKKHKSVHAISEPARLKGGRLSEINGSYSWNFGVGGFDLVVALSHRVSKTT
ncbi:hypothetical protein CR513_34562, partial [Mucuna pruriens]